MSMVHEVESFLRGEHLCTGLKVVKLSSEGALPIHLFRHFCCRMYHLATMQHQRQTDGRTDSRQYHANSRPYCLLYDRLKIDLTACCMIG